MELELAAEVARNRVAPAEVVAAIMRVDRSRFVPRDWKDAAHEDSALPIGEAQTISQPTVVASMTAALQVRPGMKVLEVGTGSGYQAAVLCELGARVWSIERIAGLAERAALALASAGYRVHLRVGDGLRGWPEAAPFDGIVVTAAAEQVPPALLQQLAEGGRLVMPVGGPDVQALQTHVRHGPRFEVEHGLAVRFVPLLPGVR